MLLAEKAAKYEPAKRFAADSFLRAERLRNEHE